MYMTVMSMRRSIHGPTMSAVSMTWWYACHAYNLYNIYNMLHKHFIYHVHLKHCWNHGRRTHRMRRTYRMHHTSTVCIVGTAGTAGTAHMLTLQCTHKWNATAVHRYSAAQCRCTAPACIALHCTAGMHVCAPTRDALLCTSSCDAQALHCTTLQACTHCIAQHSMGTHTTHAQHCTYALHTPGDQHVEDVRRCLELQPADRRLGHIAGDCINCLLH